MAQGTIENPVINSPFGEPERHFVMLDGKPTGETEDRRRPSEFFVPVAQPKKKSAAQLSFDQFGPPTKQQPNEIVNEIRQAVARWRQQDYPHTTSVTKDLLAYWRDEDRERRLFFCQIEAAETAIYLTEAAEKLGDTNALNQMNARNTAHRTVSKALTRCNSCTTCSPSEGMKPLRKLRRTCSPITS